jgi:hypothetical protein
MTSNKLLEDRPGAADRWDELTERRRRQLLTIAAIRSFASVAVLAMAYFLMRMVTARSSS